MVPRTLLSALAAVAALGTAAAQTPCEAPRAAEPTAAVHRLRFVAAADAAAALNAFALRQNLSVIVAPEPVSNTVLVDGDPAGRKRVAAILAALDKEPPTVVVRMLIMRAPAGFAEEVGLGEAGEAKWVLTPREVRMLTAAIRGAKEHGGIDVLSRPQLMLTDNQTGFFQVGQQPAPGPGPTAVTDGLVTRVTPRISPDGGSVLLRVETQFSKVNPAPVVLGDGAQAPVIDTQAIQTTESVPNGGTLVVRGARSKTADGGATEMLAVITVDRVTTQPVK